MSLARMLPRPPVSLSKPAFNAFRQRSSSISSWPTPARLQAEPWPDGPGQRSKLPCILYTGVAFMGHLFGRNLRMQMDIGIEEADRRAIAVGLSRLLAD